MPLKNIYIYKKSASLNLRNSDLKQEPLWDMMALAKSYSRIWGGGGVRNGEFSLVEGTKLQLN